MASLLRWYNPLVVRVGLLALSIAVSLATGNGVVFAGDDGSGP